MRLGSALVLLCVACSSRSAPAPEPNPKAIPPARQAWTFDELLAPPSAAEIAAVDRGWPEELAVSDAKITRRLAHTFAGIGAYEARAVTHRLDGEERCGFVLVPSGAQEGSLAALLDVRDIRWDYPPRDISRGPYVMTRILRDAAKRFAIVIPCVRGETLSLAGHTITASGDRRDAWDGAALDTIAFMTAALVVTPEIDATRIVAYGYSRGGGVALLVAQRDPRVRAVAAFAAPTDWFTAMSDQDGHWSQRLAAAVHDGSLPPDSLRSQFLDWFVRDGESLARMRRRMLASSPRYFVWRLPLAQVHHGENDSSVPVENAAVLREAAAAAQAEVDVRIHAGEPHLLRDEAGAYSAARAFLLDAVKSH